MHTIKVTHFKHTLSLFVNVQSCENITKISFREFLSPYKDPSYLFAVNPHLSTYHFCLFINTAIHFSVYLYIYALQTIHFSLLCTDYVKNTQYLILDILPFILIQFPHFYSCFICEYTHTFIYIPKYITNRIILKELIKKQCVYTQG